MKSFKQYFLESEDYRGSHTAPNKNDTPLWNVIDVYGKDFYSLPSDTVARYYAHYADYRDKTAVNIIRNFYNKPNAKIKIYRAVPKILSIRDQINELNQKKSKFLRRGRVPYGYDKKTYFSDLVDKIESLQRSPDLDKPETKITINPNDWVTIDRNYAIEHKNSALGGKGKILTKTVLVKHLYTDGNSIFEWGYDPS
jgi:hypothetical protein